VDRTSLAAIRWMAESESYDVIGVIKLAKVSWSG